jgi:hypothetical protein
VNESWNKVTPQRSTHRFDLGRALIQSEQTPLQRTETVDSTTFIRTEQTTSTE